MSNLKERLASCAVAIPRVVLPKEGTDFEKWAVVACDQYSSEKEYWNDVEKQVGDNPSTLNLIFPECYLEDSDKAQRIKNIHSAMDNYVKTNVVKEIEAGFVLVERHTAFSKIPRIGLVIAVDLEKYRYGQGVTSLIRPTEGTIVERLPPRMEIRRGAPLELPHIMLLVDDAKRSIIEPLYAKMDSYKKLYDFDLMKGSGHIKGALISDEKSIESIVTALEKLADAKAYKEKHGKDDVLLFAVGDGNHSLATAKATWEEIKKAGENDPNIMNHPSRYALVELVNVYDEGLPFHPIHRALFKVDEDNFLSEIQKAGFEFKEMAWDEAVKLTDESNKEHRFAFVSPKKTGLLSFKNPVSKLAVGTIQSFIDPYLKNHSGVVIDYIHGTDSLKNMGSTVGNLGVYLPPVDKSSFFATVIHDGVMPRKTFSMGEAPEKRFYIEARKIN